MTPAETLRVYRAQHHLTQVQLATQLQVSRVTVNNWENGHVTVPAKALEALATGVPYGKSGESLCTGHNCPDAFHRVMIGRKAYWWRNLRHPKWFMGVNCPLRAQALEAGRTDSATMEEYNAHAAPAVEQVITWCRAVGVTDTKTRSWLESIGHAWPE